MSCRGTKGNSAASSLALALTPADDTVVQSTFHRLKREGAGQAAPSREQVDAFLDEQSYRARNSGLSASRLRGLQDRLDLARSEETPDGATFHAWRNVVAESDIATRAIRDERLRERAADRYGIGLISPDAVPGAFWETHGPDGVRDWEREHGPRYDPYEKDEEFRPDHPWAFATPEVLHVGSPLGSGQEQISSTAVTAFATEIIPDPDGVVRYRDADGNPNDPYVVRHNGQDFLVNGHHRIAAARSRSLPVQVARYDLDARRAAGPQVPIPAGRSEAVDHIIEDGHVYENAMLSEEDHDPNDSVHTDAEVDEYHEWLHATGAVDHRH